MGVTIKQIAEMAGVHRSTVDKVLHKRPGVSDDVRKKVQQIIDENNYEANPIGKALKMQNRELRIAVLLLKVDALSYIRKGIEEKLKEYSSFQIHLEFQIIAYSHVQKQAELLDRYREKKVDGIILSPINAHEIVEAIDRCTEEKIPVVTVNSDIKGSKRFCFIGQDGYKAGKVAARFMGEFLNGKGRTVVITSDGDEHQSFPFGTREGGFRTVITEAYPGIRMLPSVTTKEDPAIMRREMQRILREEKDIDGILVTCGCVQAAGEELKSSGRRDVRLICYEDYPEILDLMREDVVTMTLGSGLNEQGRKSIEVLLDKLIYDRNPYRKHLYSEIHVMVKESL